MAGRKNPTETLARDSTQNVVLISDGAHSFHLRRPIDIDVRQQEGRFVMALPDLGILEYGRTEREALEAVAKHFAAVWFDVAEEPDSRLTPDAIELKRNMRDLVARVGTR